MAKHMKKHPLKKKSPDAPAVMTVRRENNTWKYLSIVLGVLLIVSVFTGGFSIGTSVDTVKADINSLLAKESSASVKTALNNALVELDKVSSIKTANTGSTGSTGNNGGEGKIIIEEFSDFECPFCSRALPTVEQIKSTYGDDVEIVYKHFPLSFHPNAQKAGEASECARDQGKFWEMHDKLFANQQALSPANYKTWAGELGLDVDAFSNCLDSNEKAQIVQDDFNEGRAKGVSGTPTFFINGQKVVGAQPFTAFQPIIDAALSGEAPTVAPTAPTPTTPPPTPTEVTASMDDDPVKGSEDAKVVIVEWSDFQCPFCQRFYQQTLPSIESEYIDTGLVKLVYRDFPLSFHPEAAPAAEAAECAHDQGKFWEMHDLLFDNIQTLSAANYKVWAQELGLDMDEFNNCVDTRKYQNEVAADMAAGGTSGVTGTPGFVVGVLQEDGKTVVGQSIKGAQPFASFKAVIDAELAKVEG